MKIALLGSTGSIGTTVLNVVRRYPGKFEICALSAGGNYGLFLKQIKEFKPKCASLSDINAAGKIKGDIPKNTVFFQGADGACECIRESGADLVFNAVTGFAGLKTVLAAIENKKTVALANKESLVCGGKLITAFAKKNKVKIIPVDSEHSAIWQCLNFNLNKKLQRIILTASGGPFRNYTKEQLKNVTPEIALKHPNWSMGKKITIDSATLMNKGLEVIEASFLFNMHYDKIDAVIHPQSIIHSMVEFEDNGVLAQMSYPDMEIPVQLALTYPERLKTALPRLDFEKIRSLEFERIDTDRFPCFSLAVESLKAGGNLPCALSCANEAAVELFLSGKISFTQIPEYIEKVLDKINKIDNYSFEDLIETARYCELNE